MQSQDKVLISDFDGTMTKYDFFRVALSRMPPAAAAPWKRYEQGAMSHFDALALIFSRMRITQPELDALLVEMRLEHGLSAAVDKLNRAGWQLVIASAGCEYYVERMLFRAGIDAAIHANPGSFIPGKGLAMSKELMSPFYSAETGVDKAAIVKWYLDRGCETAFAGDGSPDLAPALLVTAERRFARGWLADELEKRREPFVRFERWPEIEGYLCGGAA